MHTLARILAASESFRDQRDADADPPIEEIPLDPQITEGLFMVLYFLSERVEWVAMVMPLG
ncbi:hypothetical protein [Dyella tabacisoli]|uniref:Uncharacterized protein n=1 Tax=Dyella tabacisoli TaxID=2282381 RepID=A0A369UPC5_9GAMM|nr:hypothetical protein [Dyella tabacisoli]RDD81470.1 hypothetical protein DVJ77_09790 [Dyella tabacisoli]